MAEARDPVDQLLELMLYAPLGLLIEARRRLPELSRLGRTEVEQRVQLARFVGEFAVRRAGKTLADQAASLRRAAEAPAARVTASGPTRSEPTQAPATAGGPTVAPAPATPKDEDAPSGVGDLAIAGYDSLAASQIVRLLDGLADDELTAIERYESSHRGRQTILGKIDQVRTER